MNFKFHQYVFKLLSVLFLIIVSGSILSAQTYNLALNKSYELTPKPNYTLCTDACDIYDLTDGVKKGSYWGLKTTVGWRSTPDHPDVTVDLKEECQIENILIYSAAGTRGGVTSCDSVIVLVSSDGKAYRLAAYYEVPEDIRKAALKERMISPVFNIKVGSSGRFVKLIFMHEGAFIFLDEVEIFGSVIKEKSKSLYNQLPVEIKSDYPFNALKQAKNRLEFVKAVDYANEIYSLNEKIKDSPAFKKFQEFKNRIKVLDVIKISDMELLRYKNEFSALKSEIYQYYYRKPVVVLPAEPAVSLLQNEIILSDANNLKTDVYMWQNEYDVVAFNIINCSDKYLNVQASISPLMSDEKKVLSSKEVFEIRYGYFTYGWEIGFNADALMLQCPEVNKVEPGGILQVWITVNSKNLKMGSYKAAIQFIAEPDKEVLSNYGTALASIAPVPIRLDIAPLSLPAKLDLNTYNWAYPTISDTIKNCLPDVAEDLRKHYANVLVLPSKNIPFPAKRQVSIGRQLMGSTRQMDEWLGLNKDADMVLLFMSFRPKKSVFGEWMTPVWKQNFKQWLFELTEHLKTLGIGYDKFALYPFDEYIGDDFYDLVTFVKEINPHIKIFANSFGRGPQEYMRLRDIVDIWCLPRGIIEQKNEWFTEVKSFGRPVWMYYASKRASDPLVQYRNIFWWVFKNNIKGLGFWVYCSTYPGPWDDFRQPKGDCSVIYGKYNSPINTQECVIPSRRWDIWRLGVQDYEHLFQLQSRISKLSEIDGDKAVKIKTGLDKIVDKVISQKKDSTEVNKAKRFITESILEIDQLLK